MPLVTEIAVKALRFGLLIRGAITVGEFYHKNGIFFGKAFNETYNLESKIAFYPRIIISDKIFEKNLILGPSGQNIPHSQQLWLQDFDCLNYLNYFFYTSFGSTFGPRISSHDKEISDYEVKKWIEDCSEIINKKINCYSTGTTKDIRKLQNWHWFLDYFQKSMMSLAKHDSWAGATYP